MVQSTDTQVERSLAGVKILARVSPDSLDQVQQGCSWQHYGVGELIVDYLDSFR